MKIAVSLFGALSFLASPALSAQPPAPDPRAVEVKWDSNNPKVIQDNDTILIEFHTGGIAGHRIVQTEIQSFSNYPFVTLTYQIVQNITKSFRHPENFFVSWRIPKAEYTKLRNERRFYILRKDDVLLSSEEIRELQ